jgi:hypothetical protein
MRYLLLLTAALMSTSSASACTVPVFRYALEKWDLTPYEIFVYHDGALPNALTKELAKWDVPNRANIEITLLNVKGKLTTEQTKLLERYGKNEKLPWMLVRSKAPEAPDVAWSGACTIDHLDALIDSPMRRTLLAHLTRGDSAVYLLLTSDDEKADREAYALAVKELKQLEKAIPLPEQKDDGPKLRLPLPLKMSLPLLVLDRKSADEAALIRLLLGVEDGLDKAKGPMLFAIYGKGRVLPPLYNHGEVANLNAKMLLHVTQFLCGPCSCEVKDRVPGTDLLMLANWNDVFDQMFDGKEVFPMPKTHYFALPSRYAPVVEAEPSTSVIQMPPMESPAFTAAPHSPAHDESIRGWLWIGAAVASGLVMLTGGWLVLALRK